MKKFMLVTVMLAAGAACAQLSRGTVIIFNFSKDKLVVAADSREITINANGGESPPNDTYCKLSIFRHKIVFTSVGGAGYIQQGADDPVSGWSNEALARIAVQTADVSDDAQTRIRRVAERWADLLLPLWNSYYASHPQEVMRTVEKYKGQVTVGVFSQASNGRIYYQPVALVFQSRNLPAPIVPMFASGLRDCWPCGQGDSSVCVGGTGIDITAKVCSQETHAFFHPSDLVLQSLGRNAALTIKLADLAIAFSGDHGVGGPIDAVELQNDGRLRWIQRKQNCPDNQD
jgi:hypothetical protein